MSTALSTVAWKSWVAGGAPVPADQAPDRSELVPALEAGTLIEEAGGFRLPDAAALVQGAAAFVIENERAGLTSSGEACFRRLHQLWIQDKVETHSLPGQVLAALHNGRQIDAYASARQAVEADVRSYDVLQILEEAVAFFTHAEAASMVQFFGGDYGKNRHVFGGSIYPRIEPWLMKHPEAARDIKRLHEEHPGDKGEGLYGCALQALVNVDFAAGWQLAREAAVSANPLIAGPGLHVLGLVDYADPAKADAANDTIRICTQILRVPEHPLLGTAISVLGRLIGSHETVVVPLLDEVGKTRQLEALTALANVLFRDARDRWAKPWFWDLVLHLTRIPAAHREILSIVDMMLNGWVKNPDRVPRVIEFLNLWMAQQSPEALKKAGPETVFDSAIHRLAERSAPFSGLLTAWLLDEDRRYPHAIYKIIGRLRVAGACQFSLAPEVLDALGPEELRFLLRRMIGYLSSEEILLPLVFSMVRTRDARERTFGFVAGVLRDRLGRDYPGDTLEFLKEKQAAQDESEDVKSFCGSIARDIEARLAELDALPNLKEFHPPAAKVHRFLKERRRQMNEAMEEAGKNSIWKQIATEIPLKGGTRTFHRMQGRYSNPMELKPMSHTVSIPFSEVSDPLGSARERLSFRSTKKPAP